MRGMVLLAGWSMMAVSAWAQPADCPAAPAQAGSIPVTVDLSGRPGVPSGVGGKARFAVPMQAPQSNCGEPTAPADVLRGPPGDLLLGTPAPTPPQ